MEQETCDVLVLGSGIAGLYTALKARDLGQVTLLTKKKLEDSNTEFAQGGIAAAMAPGDSPALHLEDTLAAGVGLCDPTAVKVLVEEGPDCVRDLAERGVRFDMTGEDFELTREAAHSRRRILHARGDATGDEIRRGLEAAVRADPRILVREDEFAIDLVLDDAGRCWGVLSLGPDGRLRTFLARATVLATGGAGRLYRHSTNPDVATGDGIAMAYRAGAAAMDMEFIQFHPTALYLPAPGMAQGLPARAPGGSRPRVLISEAVRGEGAFLINRLGERFMPGYHPRAELAPRDVVARSIAQEMERTGHPCVYLDARPLGPGFPGRFPTIHELCLRHGIDPLREPIPVAPAAHYIMGGVRTDLMGRTGIPGLFACGEVACTGVHGANRLASNSLLEGVVFGHRIAQALAGELPAEGPPSFRALSGAPALGLALALPAKEQEVATAWRSLQRTMWQHVGLYRDEEGLQEALATVEGLFTRLEDGHKRRAGQPSPLQRTGPEGRSLPGRAALELVNLSTAAWLVARSALERRESRGAHFRTDHPARNDADWTRHIVIARGRLDTVPLQ